MFPVIKPQASESLREAKLLDINIFYSEENEEFKRDVDVVIQSFLVLLSVPKRSRWWRPEYGTVRLYDLLFEPFDKYTADDIANTIQIVGDSFSNGNSSLRVESVLVLLASDETYKVTLGISVAGFSTEQIEFGLKKLR